MPDRQRPVLEFAVATKQVLAAEGRGGRWQPGSLDQQVAAPRRHQGQKLVTPMKGELTNLRNYPPAPTAMSGYPTPLSIPAIASNGNLAFRVISVRFLFISGSETGHYGRNFLAHRYLQ